MLDKELWKRLPAVLPSLADVLNARSSSSDEAVGSSGGGTGSSSSTAGGGSSSTGGGGGPLSEFERFVVQGNPWRKQQSPRRGRRGAGAGQQQQLGFGGSAGTDDSTAARQLEVDEYGVPRTASNTPSASAAGGGGGGRSGSAQSEGGVTEDGETEDGEVLQEEENDDVFGE